MKKEYKKWVGFPGIEFIMSKTKRGAILAYNRGIISDMVKESTK